MKPDPGSYPRQVYSHRRGGTFCAAFLLSFLLVRMDPMWGPNSMSLGGLGILAAIIVTLTCFVVIRRTTLWICSPNGSVRVRHVGMLGGVDVEFAPSQLELQVLVGDLFHVLWLDLPGRSLGISLRIGKRRSIELLAQRLAETLGCRVREVRGDER